MWFWCLKVRLGVCFWYYLYLDVRRLVVFGCSDWFIFMKNCGLEYGIVDECLVCVWCFNDGFVVM